MLRYYSALLLFLLLMVKANATIVLDANYTSGGSSFAASSNCQMQTFRPTITGNLESIDVQINSTGVNNFTFDLVLGNPASPISTIGTVTVVAPNGLNWVKARFPFCGPSLTATTEYFIRVSGNVSWIGNNLGTYPGGNHYQCPSVSFGAEDLNFKLFMYTTCSAPTPGANQGGIVAMTPTSPLGVNTGGDNGVWSSSGAGSFSDILDPNATYTPSCGEAGTLVTLTWTSCCNTAPTCNQTVNVVPPSVSVSSATICAGGSANLVAGGAVTYVWSANAGGSTSSSVLVSPAITTTYTVTGTQTNGCFYPQIATVTVNNPPNVIVNNNGPVCPGSPLSLTATPSGGVAPYSYSWVGPNAFSSTLQNPLVSASASPIMGGNYTLTITGSNSCSAAPAITTVTIKPAPTGIANNNGPVCQGTTLSLTGSPVGGVGPYSYSWNGPGAFSSTLQNPNVSASAAPAMAGNYTLVVTGSNACVSPPALTTVIVRAAVSGSLSTTNVSCFGGNNGTINVTPSGGSGPYTYSFNGGAFTAPTSYTSLSIGTYSIIVKDNFGCNSPQVTATITQPPAALTGSLASTSSVTCNSLSNGSATITQAGGTSPYQYSIDGGSTYVVGNTFSGLSAGSYTVKVRDANLCISNDVIFSITQPAPLSIGTAGGTTVCSGTPLNITLSGVGGTPGYNFTWVTSDNVNTTGETFGTAANTSLINNTITNPTATAQTLTYTLTLIDANSCAANQNLTVTVNPLPNTPTPITNAVCFGSASNFSTAFVAGGIYNWNFADATTSTVQNPSHVYSTPGVYTASVTVSVAGCSSAPGTVNATVNAIPSTPAPTSNSPVCQGAATVLNVSAVGGATNYNWDFGDASAQQNNASNTSVSHFYPTGTYNVTLVVTGAGGCLSNPGVISVTTNPTPSTPTPTASTVCFGNSTNFTTAAVGGASYNWDFGDGNTSSLQNPSHSYATSGVYTASLITTVLGCPSAPGNVNATVNALPSVSISPTANPICAGGTTDLTASGANTYSWAGSNLSSTTGVTVTASPTASITYTVVGTNTLTTCMGNSTISISVNPLPSIAAAGPDQFLCGVNSVPLAANTPTAGVGTWTIVSGAGGSFVSVNNPTTIFNGVVGASYILRWTINAAPCGFSQDDVNINFNPRPNFTVVAPTTICSGNDLSLNVGSLTGGTTFSYNWTGPNSFTSSIPNPIRNSVNVIDGGSYVLQIINEFACSFTNSQVITVNPTPFANITGGPNLICANAYASLTGSTSSANGDVIVGYQWMQGSTPIAGATSVNYSANNPGTYFLEVTNANGCVDTSVVFALANKPTPSPVITGSMSFCNGSSTVLDASSSTPGGASTITAYEWIFNGTPITASNTVNYTAASGGNYQLVVYTSNGCNDTSTASFVSVLFPPAAPTLVAPGVMVCFNDTVSLVIQSPVGAHTYNWLGQAGLNLLNTSGPFSQAVGTTVGSYTVDVTETDLNGCISAASTATVNVVPLPVANILPPSASNICYDGSVGLSLSTVAGALAYNWTSTVGLSSSAQSPTFSNITTPGSILFFGTVVDGNGCLSLKDTIGIFVNNPVATPSISGTATAVCIGQAFTLNASPVIAGATYDWTDPSSAIQSGVDLNSITIPVSTTTNLGPYTLVYTDLNGCTSQSSTAFNQFATASPVVSIAGPTNICSGNTTTLNATTSVGSASTFQWYQNGAAIPGATSSSYVANTASNYNVEITLTNGCLDTANTSANVVVNALPVVTINPPSTTICEGSSVTLTASGASTYIWSNSSSTASITVSPISPLSLNVQGTDINGCIGTNTVLINVNPKPTTPTALASTNTECVGTNVVLNSSSSLTNSWYNITTNTFIGNLQSFSHTETVSGTYNYAVYVTDANSCNSDTSYTSVTFNNCLSNLNPEFETIFANTSSSNNILVNDGSPSGLTINTSPVLGPVNGTFTINSSGGFTYTPANGFSGFDMIVISVCNASSFCTNDTIHVRVNPYAGTDLGTVNSLVPNAQLTGNVLTNDAGTGISGSVLLISNVSHGTLTISTSGDFVYVPTANYCGLDSFIYQISDANTFVTYGYCIIDVSCSTTIITHTGFSPNNDGTNDVWVIANIDVSPNKVTIYDRWGNEVWGGENYNNTSVVWNGKNKNNEDLTAGTYFYMIEVKDQKAVRGWVEITK